ncbi:collagen-like protein [Zestomonas thermotolerans]|uniref:collagen-like protein n=1 Tax=Zestomonas thermotolerans TaxID=157784 RepID=UPI0023F3CEAF|nr:collagen-like protein [Pseudomonas thermotolerans]
MRKALLLAAFCASVAQAETSIEVRPNTLLRLPTTSAQLALDRLEVGDAGTLLIPAGLDEIRVGELRLGREASIGIAPSERVFRLEARQAVLGEGSRISARGAAGNHQRPATAGRDLSLRLERAEVTGLTLDVRGGRGAPGYRGLDGADGKAGGDGQSGGQGGRIRLEVPEDFPAERLQVLLQGGPGGEPGAGGQGGRAGKAKGCWLYRVAGAGGGRPGLAGQPGASGADGALELVRLTAPAGESVGALTRGAEESAE